MEVVVPCWFCRRERAEATNRALNASLAPLPPLSSILGGWWSVVGGRLPLAKPALSDAERVVSGRWSVVRSLFLVLGSRRSVVTVLRIASATCEIGHAHCVIRS